MDEQVRDVEYVTVFLDQLEEHAEKWRQAGKDILKVMSEEAAKIVARQLCQRHLRGKYVHAHKGKVKRQHQRPDTFEWMCKHPNFLPKLTLRYMEMILDGK